jgi:hypothetical protein
MENIKVVRIFIKKIQGFVTYIAHKTPRELIIKIKVNMLKLYEKIKPIHSSKLAEVK